MNRATQEVTCNLAYVIDYLKEELARWGEMEYREDEIEDMVQNALEAYAGGAR